MTFERRPNVVLSPIRCVPHCRACGKSLVVTEEPLGFVRGVFGFEEEWSPTNGRVRACREHPHDPPVWKEQES
jgi:hypothetical protein